MNQNRKLFLLKIKRIYHFFKTGLFKALPCAIFYGFPQKKIKIITITGTDGKTTSVNLLYNILKTDNKKVSMVSTVKAIINNEPIETGLHTTTPDPCKIYKWLHEAVKRKNEFFILEITSHGAFQFRNFLLHSFISGITNITHEHLDYHITMDEYIKAKSLILNNSDICVLNKDDLNFKKLKSLCNKKTKIETYSYDWLKQSDIDEVIKQTFPEKYNRMNAKLCAKIATLIGIQRKNIIKGIKTYKHVKGRKQEIKNKRKLKVFVDFAHTPNAIKNILSSIKENIKEGEKTRIISVFGSAGKRDHTKRPQMGEYATKFSDFVILTSDDPRDENIWHIIREIKEGTRQAMYKVISIPDRVKAINFAINKLAQPSDIIVVMGKGAEQSLAIGKKEYKWDDTIVCTLALEKKLTDKDTMFDFEKLEKRLKYE